MFILEMWRDFIILEPDSHWVIWVVGVMQKDSKDKAQGFESFVFWVFLHDLNDPNDLEGESDLSASLLYLFNQGDVYEFYILFKGKLKFTGAVENIHDTNHG